MKLNPIRWLDYQLSAQNPAHQKFWQRCRLLWLQIFHYTRPPVQKQSIAILLRRYCNMLRISGFVDDVVFSYNVPYGGVMLRQQPRCNVVHRLTPLLRGIGLHPVIDDGWRQD